MAFYLRSCSLAYSLYSCRCWRDIILIIVLSVTVELAQRSNNLVLLLKYWNTIVVWTVSYNYCIAEGKWQSSVYIDICQHCSVHCHYLHRWKFGHFTQVKWIIALLTCAFLPCRPTSVNMSCNSSAIYWALPLLSLSCHRLTFYPCRWIIYWIVNICSKYELLCDLLCKNLVVASAVSLSVYFKLCSPLVRKIHLLVLYRASMWSRLRNAEVNFQL